MLSPEEKVELTHFLNRLQGKEVRVELASRLNVGYRVSFAVTVSAAAGKTYNFTSDSGNASVFIDPEEAEAYSSDHTSISLVYGDDLITVRYGRTR
ncbi:MAG: hypothetical protein HRT47_04445 [Candidatus Caenarcaniphilales bacterium]|nr:hypothetical protein [Candidatus Caenarcaniphilales bacterium]